MTLNGRCAGGVGVGVFLTTGGGEGVFCKYVGGEAALLEGAGDMRPADEK